MGKLIKSPFNLCTDMIVVNSIRKIRAAIRKHSISIRICMLSNYYK